MTDIVHYKLPLWFLGDTTNSLFVKKLKVIFDYRHKKVEKLFPHPLKCNFIWLRIFLWTDICFLIKHRCVIKIPIHRNSLVRYAFGEL